MSDTTWPQASIDVAEPDGVLTVEFDGDDVPMEADDSWNRSDVVGIFLSVLCAIHCATMPLLIAALPSLGLSWFEQPWVHQVLFAGCLLLAGNAVLRGYRVHRRPFVPGVAAAGLALLAASAFVFPPPCCAAGAESGTTAAGACQESCCANCATATTSTNAPDGGAATVDVSGSTAAMSSWTDWSLTDWWLRLMTPLGGLLLIVAHSLNIKWVRSCRCGCCPASLKRLSRL